MFGLAVYLWRYVLRLLTKLVDYSLTILSVITRIQPYGYTAQGTVFKFDWLYIVHVCTALLMTYE